MKLVYLHQGEVRAAAKPCRFRTVLGSCVSVCLWDPVLEIGGLNHIVLPDGGAANGDARFADAAIPQLLAHLRRMGAVRLVAKLFGGAQVMAAEGENTVGAANVRAAYDLLAAQGIEVVASRTGGTLGIVLQFLSHTGEAQVRPIAHGRSAREIAIAKASWAARANR